MTHKDVCRQYAHICAALALLYRDPDKIPKTEQREAAKALGLEHMLPSETQERLRLTA